MLEYPPEQTLSSNSLPGDLDFSLYLSFLQQLKGSSQVLVLRSSDFTTLPQEDDVTALSSAMKDFEEYIGNNADEVKALRLSGSYFHELREYLDKVKKHPLSAADSSLTEPFYGVKFHASKYHASSDSAADVSGLKLPDVNKYICYELDVDITADVKDKELDNDDDDEKDHHRAEESAPTDKKRKVKSSPPTVIKTDDATDGQFWFSKDEVFRQPRTSLSLFLATNQVLTASPIMPLIGTLWSQLAARKYYNAALAGLNFDFSLTRRGLDFSFVGFTSDKLLDLAKEVARDISDTSFWQGINQGIFDNYRERQLRALKSCTRSTHIHIVLIYIGCPG